jgi:homoserine dehydrogenase
MPREFSFLEKQLIAGSLKRCTDEEIAEMFEASVDDVTPYINELTDGKAAERQQSILTARDKIILIEQQKLRKQLDKKYEVERAAERQKQRNVREKIDHQRRTHMNAREGRKIFKKRDLKLDELISVKIDSKTTVFVKPGSDIEAIKKLYTRKPLGPDIN